MASLRDLRKEFLNGDFGDLWDEERSFSLGTQIEDAEDAVGKENTEHRTPNIQHPISK